MAFQWKSDYEIRFEDVLPSAVNWVRFWDDGQLEVEHYDVSERAKSATGGEVAWFVRVGEEDLPAVASALGARQDLSVDLRREILQKMGEKFCSGYSIREWYEDNGIAYNYERDPWP